MLSFCHICGRVSRVLGLGYFLRKGQLLVNASLGTPGQRSLRDLRDLPRVRERVPLRRRRGSSLPGRRRTTHPFHSNPPKIMDSLLAHQAEKIEMIDAEIRAIEADEAARISTHKNLAAERAQRIMNMLDDWIPLSITEPISSPAASPPRKIPQAAVSQHEGLQGTNSAQSSDPAPYALLPDAPLSELPQQPGERSGERVDQFSTAASSLVGTPGRISAVASSFFATAAAAGSIMSPETAPPRPHVNASPPPATAPPQFAAPPHQQANAPPQCCAPPPYAAPPSARGLSSAGSTTSSRAPGSLAGSTMSSRVPSTASSAARSTPRTATAARARVEALQAAVARTDAYAKRRR